VNYAHLHIVLNHFPSIGTTIALGLLIASIFKKNQDLRRASFVLLVIMSLLVIPTYLTGSAAQQAIQKREGLSPAAIEAHQNSAMLAFTFLIFTGGFAWLGLWQYRRFSRPASWNLAVILFLSFATLALMTRTGALGGEISHPEIRGEASGAEAIVGWRSLVQDFVANHSWVWPAGESLHFIGMAVLFGVALVVNLRMLDMMKSIPFSAVHRLLPLGVLGFGLNVLTGMLFYIRGAERYISPTFALKIFLIVLAGVNLIHFTLFDQAWKVGSGDKSPLMCKVIAVSTLGFLLGAMYFGRMIPYLGCTGC